MATMIIVSGELLNELAAGLQGVLDDAMRRIVPHCGDPRRKRDPDYPRHLARWDGAFALLGELGCAHGPQSASVEVDLAMHSQALAEALQLQASGRLDALITEARAGTGVPDCREQADRVHALSDLLLGVQAGRAHIEARDRKLPQMHAHAA